MSPELPDAAPTAWSEEIVSPPSAVAVQFDPSAPFARAKLSTSLDAPDVAAVQLTMMLVTLAEPTEPDALPAVHACPAGLDATVTL